MEKFPSVEKTKYVGQTDTPCIVPSSSFNSNGNEYKRSSYRVNRHRTDKKSQLQDELPSNNEIMNYKSDNLKFKPLNATGNIVGMCLRQITKSIVAPSDKENASMPCSPGNKTSYNVNSEETTNKNSVSVTTPLRRTKISPTKESPSKNAFTCDSVDPDTSETSPKRKQKAKVKEAIVSRKSGNKRKNKRRGKSDLGYVESFSFDEPSSPRDDVEANTSKNEEKEDKSRFIENELSPELSSDSFDLYDDFYKKTNIDRQDSFGSDSAVGTMKSDFFADIDLAKIRDGSSAIFQELCRVNDKAPATSKNKSASFESTAL